MLKKMFSLAVLVLVCLGGGQSQTTTQSNSVFKGHDGSKTVILNSIYGGYTQFLSGDNRYLSGILGGAYGFAYDFEKDTTLQYEFTLPGFISPDHYIGQDDPGETVVHAFAYYNGVKTPLEPILASGKPSYDDIFVTAVQGNGEKVVTMGYETYTKPSGSQGFINIVAIHDGKTGKLKFKLPLCWDVPIDGDALGFGARGDCISGDGTVVGGHSTNPFVKNKWSLAFWDISDPDNIRKYGLDSKEFDFGTFWGASYDGSILVGGSESNSTGVIVHYDKTNHTFTVDTLQPLPSWDYLEFEGVADNGLIIGYCGNALDPGTREPIVYSELTGVVKMNEFLYEYYDIDLGKRNFYTPMAISRDGSIWAGFFYDDAGYAVPWYTKLSDERIMPRARKISARAARGALEASITWQNPLPSEHTLQGYNIYRDDNTTPLNASLLPTTTISFNDNAEEYGLTSGRHTYYIEAVYEDGITAMKAASNIVQVVKPGDCFPVQHIDHLVDYNRYATIFWGQPSSEVSDLAQNDVVTPSEKAMGRFNIAAEALPQRAEQAEPTAVPQPKSYTSTSLDYIANVDMLTYSGFAAIKIGDYYYTSSHLGGGIQILDRFNDVVRTIAPAGLGAVLAMVYDEDKDILYCGTMNGIKTIDLGHDDEMDILNQEPARFLAYVPELDGGKGGFVAGREHSCHTYTMDGERIDSDILDFGKLFACGAAYHDGRLYVSSASGKYYNEIYIYDFAKREQIGDPIQVVEDPALYNLLSFDGTLPSLDGVTQAGGLSICKLDDGTTALGAVFQCLYMTTRLMFLEIESDASVKGYDLYRSKDGAEFQKLNAEPLARRRYAETLDQPGQYAYYVVVLPEAAGAEASAPSPIDTVTIAKPGICPKSAFSISESNSWPVLEWMPQESANVLIGFNLYRDGTELGQFWNEAMRLDYVDDEITELGTYTYRLETLYEDGCLSDTTLSITLTGKGSAQAPFGLTLDAKDRGNGSSYDVKATWETPMFEKPLSLRYCNAVMLNAVVFDKYNECWAAIGWDKANLGLYRDLYLVGMEFMIGATPSTFECFVILNDQMVHTHKVARPIARSWQTVMFDRSFPMDQPEEVAVGYHTTYTTENNGVLAVDESVSVTGYSDLITLDGKQWSTLKAGGKKGSWCIGALVVHKRDLDAAKRPDGTIDYKQLEGSIIRMAQNQPLNAGITTLPGTFSAKPSPKAELSLTGFNLYRRQADADASSQVKLNNELLTSFEWLDEAVPTDEYTYTVSAVYADGQEIMLDKTIDLISAETEDLTFALSLNLYPNPASEVLNIGGAYETLQIFDLSGRLMGTHRATAQIPLSGLQPGTYFFHFTDADAHKAVYKVVVR